MSVVNKTYGDTNPQKIDISGILSANNKVEGDIAAMQFVLKEYPGQTDANAVFNKSMPAITIASGIVSVPFATADYSSIGECKQYFVGFSIQFTGDEAATIHPIDCLTAIHFNQQVVG